MSADPVHLDRIGTFRLPMAAPVAFELFTPEGERRWIPGWSPGYLHPTDGAVGEGLVFRTGHEGELVHWLVTRYLPCQLSIEYCRIAEGSRLGTVAVTCRPAGVSDTEVNVRYRMTATSGAGRSALAQFASGFEQMMVGWREAIVASIATDPARGGASR